METVKCESGNEYEIALGAGILLKIENYYASTIPASAMKRVIMEADKLGFKGKEAAKYAQEQVLIGMSKSEDDEMFANQLAATMEAVKMSLRKHDGVSIHDIEAFFDEDLSGADYKELAKVIEDAYAEFKGVVEGDEEATEGPSPSSEQGLAAEA